MYFWACERNCIYVKVNLHMCKYTPRVNFHLLRPEYMHLHIYMLYIYAFAYMYFIHICIFGHVNAQQIYTRMQM